MISDFQQSIGVHFDNFILPLIREQDKQKVCQDWKKRLIFSNFSDIFEFQRKKSILSQVTLYIYRTTSALFPSLPTDPLFEVISDCPTDFQSIKSSLLSPVWYYNSTLVWGSSGEIGYRDERGRWAEILYKTTIYRKSPLNVEELNEMKVR